MGTRHILAWSFYLLLTIIGLGIVTIGFIVFLILDPAGQTTVYVEIAKLSYQFVVVVVLGALLKKAIDDARDRRLERDADIAQLKPYIRRLVDDSHAIELAGTLIKCDRSIKTWSEQLVTAVIPAYVDLRDIQHDQRTAHKSRVATFNGWEQIEKELGKMESWAKSLINELVDNKRRLSELQRNAEQDHERHEEAWLQELPVLGDLLASNGPNYGKFRTSYSQVLSMMRADLRSR